MVKYFNWTYKYLFIIIIISIKYAQSRIAFLDLRSHSMKTFEKALVDTTQDNTIKFLIEHTRFKLFFHQTTNTSHIPFTCRCFVRRNKSSSRSSPKCIVCESRSRDSNPCRFLTVHTEVEFFVVWWWLRYVDRWCFWCPTEKWLFTCLRWWNVQFRVVYSCNVWMMIRSWLAFRMDMEISIVTWWWFVDL